MADTDLTAHARRSRARCSTRFGRQRDSLYERVCDRRLRIEHVLERLHERIDRRFDLRIVEAIFGLPLKLQLADRARNTHGENRDEPLAEIQE